MLKYAKQSNYIWVGFPQCSDGKLEEAENDFLSAVMESWKKLKTSNVLLLFIVC